MKVKRSDSLELVLEDFPLLAGAIALPAAAFLLFKVVERLAADPSLDGELFGAIVGFAVFFFTGAIFTERNLFIFRIYQKRLIWKTSGLFRRRERVIPFDEIRNVTLQVGMGRRQRDTYRLALVTDRETLPMTLGYTSGKKENFEKTAGMILNILGKDASRVIEDSILAMAQAGQKLSAIRLAQRHYRMGTQEAKQFVEDLTKA